jgi:PEP-CTERM motif-containing protein
MSTINQVSPVSAIRSKGISPKLHRKLDRYLLACSATTAAVAATGTHEAKAAIIYSGTRNIAVPALSAAGIYFDFDTNTASFTPTNGSDANIFDVYGTGSYNGQQAFYHSVSFWGPNKTGNMSLATSTTTLGSTMRLTAGTSIGPSVPSGMVFGRQNDLANQFYNYNTGAPVGAFTGQWSAGGTGYIGFKFVAANGQTDYGWMRVSLDPTRFQDQMVSATVIDWAYNNTGGAILAGQIPEPSSLALALLGGGAVGLALWRQHRARQAAAEKSQ